MEVARITSTDAVAKPKIQEPEFLIDSKGMRWGLIVCDEELRWLWTQIAKANPQDVCIDFETYGWVQEWTEEHFIEADSANIGGTAIAWIEKDGAERTFYISVGHDLQRNVTAVAHKNFLRELFKQPFNIVAHNFDYELRTMKNLFGHYLEKPNIIDTMVVAFMLCKGVPKEGKKGVTFKHGLKELGKFELGIDMIKYEEVVGERKTCQDATLIDDIRKIIEETPKKRAKKGTGLTRKSEDEIIRGIRERLGRTTWSDVQINQTDQREAGRYAAADALVPLKLLKVYRPLMDKAGLWPVYFDVVAPFLYTVAELNSNGVRIDKDHLQGIQDTLSPRATEIAEEWERLVGCSISSNQQCSERLFEEMEVWPTHGIPKTKTGHYVMDKNTVKVVLRTTEPGSLANKLAYLKSEYNEQTKITSTYTGPTLEQLKYRTNGRAKSNFSLVITKTGRLSSSSPNFQNIPRPDEENSSMVVRHAFIAEPGHVLVVGDWDGLELKITAHYSLDDILVRAFRHGADLHQERADLMGTSRNIAKSVGYGMLYGAYPKKLAQQLECDLATATKYYNDYHAIHKKIGEFSRNVIQFAKPHGYVETLLGRRRYVPYINDFDFMKRSKAEREAVNGVIQGSATDIAIVAGNLMRQDILDKGLKARILLQIHDEYVIECPEDEAEVVAGIMKHRMETCVRLNVPLTAKIGIGRSWADAK